MEINKCNENCIESKFRGKNVHEIYDYLISGKISAEEFSDRYYKELHIEKSSYTNMIKIKEAIELAKKGHSEAILEVRKLIIRMKFNK